eukprot:961870-Pelagomonas_calceolata.AAC.2
MKEQTFGVIDARPSPTDVLPCINQSVQVDANHSCIKRNGTGKNSTGQRGPSDQEVLAGHTWNHTTYPCPRGDWDA